MIPRKRLSVFRLPLWGKRIAKIAGKNLSENDLTDFHKNKFRNIFVYSFFASDPWFAKRYLEIVEEKKDFGSVANGMRSRLMRSRIAKTKKEADYLIESKISGILAKSEKVEERLRAERAWRYCSKENQIAYHLARTVLQGIVAACCGIQDYLHEGSVSKKT